MDKDAFKNAYKSEDLNALKNIGLYDKLRVHTWLATEDRAKKEKDPASKYEMLTQLWQSIKRDASYFLGEAEMASVAKEKGLDPEASLNMFMATGSSLVDKLLKE